ncbi:hypothetical protein ScPMuIL_014623 [Solemya velum]
MCNLNFRHFITGFQSCVVELYNQQLHSYCTMSSFKSTLLANAIEVKTMFNGFDPIQCFDDNDSDKCGSIANIEAGSFQCLKSYFEMKPDEMDIRPKCQLYKEGLRCIHKEMEKTLGSGQNCTLNTLNTIVSTYVGQPGYYPYIGKIKHYTDFENCSMANDLNTCTDVLSIDRIGNVYCKDYLEQSLKFKTLVLGCTFQGLYVDCVQSRTDYFVKSCTRTEMIQIINKPAFNSLHPGINFNRCPK